MGNKMATLFKTLILSSLILCVSCSRNIDSVSEVVLEEPQVEVYESTGDTIIARAREFLGSKEVNASNSGPDVDVFFDSCGVPKGNPWCGCFNGHCHILAGADVPATPAWSPSWFPESKIRWKRGGKDMTFMPGQAFAIYFISKGRIAHTGMIVEDFGDGYVLTIEGNTNSAGAREGHGVYKRIRHKSEIYAVSQWF